MYYIQKIINEFYNFNNPFNRKINQDELELQKKDIIKYRFPLFFYFYR